MSLSPFQISLQSLSLSPNQAFIHQTLTRWSASNLCLPRARLESLALGMPTDPSEADCAGSVRAFPRLRVLSLLTKVRLQHLTELQARTNAFARGPLLVDAHCPKAMQHQGAPTALVADLNLNLKLNLGPCLISSRENLVQPLAQVSLRRCVIAQSTALGIVHYAWVGWILIVVGSGIGGQCVFCVSDSCFRTFILPPPLQPSRRPCGIICNEVQWIRNDILDSFIILLQVYAKPG